MCGAGGIRLGESQTTDFADIQTRMRLSPADDGRIGIARRTDGVHDVRVPADGTQRLTVGSNPGGGVSFDLADLRLETEPQWPRRPSGSD